MVVRTLSVFLVLLHIYEIAAVAVGGVVVMGWWVREKENDLIVWV